MFNSTSNLGLRDVAFDRVVVDHLVKGGSRVTWQLRNDFQFTGTPVFAVQVGESGVPEADDWQTLTTLTNAGTYIDTAQRDGSVTAATHYRIQLTVDGQSYSSRPEPSWGTMNRRDWLRACAIARRELLRLRLSAAEPGWLFKRRKRTPLVTDPNVVDPLTGLVRATTRTAGVGTDRVGGYFTPSFFYLDLDPTARYAHRDEERGNVDDVKTKGRCLGFPQIEHGDVWASATGDARYTLHVDETLAMMRNVPLIVGVDAYKLAVTDPIYDLALPAVPPLTTLGRLEL